MSHDYSHCDLNCRNDTRTKVFAIEVGRILAYGTFKLIVQIPTFRPETLPAKSCTGSNNPLIPSPHRPQRSDSTPKKKRGAGNGYATSGQSSGSEGMALARPIMAEQAVDEILHMKLLESLVDTSTPSTIVLASGDAAEAEYSGGFLKNVERALLKGWKVELVAWHDGLSYEYRSKDFQRKWEGKFKIIELDDFCEELLAVYVQPYL